MKEEPIKIIVPRWGRTFINFMNRLYSITNDERIEKIINAVASSKDNASNNNQEAFNYLQKLIQEGNTYVTIAPDRKHPESPYRVGFLGMDILINGVSVRIEGDEPHNGTSLIKLSEADIALAGLDELLATNYPYLSKTTEVTSWGAYNYNIQEPTDLRVAGSANLKSSDGILDVVGLFLITTKQNKYKDLDELANENIPIYVKGRYEGAIANAYGSTKPRKLNLKLVNNVEDSVFNNPGSYGIEIVQSGNTIKKKDLVVIDEPLLNSESLYTVDQGKYCNNPGIQNVLDALGIVNYYNEGRAKEFTEWFYNLEKKLGENWINKSDPVTIFLGEKNGLTEVGLWPMNTRELIMNPDIDMRNEAEKERFQKTYSTTETIIMKKYNELRKSEN